MNFSYLGNLLTVDGHLVVRLCTDVNVLLPEESRQQALWSPVLLGKCSGGV